MFNRKECMKIYIEREKRIENFSQSVVKEKKFARNVSCRPAAHCPVGNGRVLVRSTAHTKGGRWVHGHGV